MEPRLYNQILSYFYTAEGFQCRFCAEKQFYSRTKENILNLQDPALIAHEEICRCSSTEHPGVHHSRDTSRKFAVYAAQTLALKIKKADTAVVSDFQL
jgi:hypothetical protein